VKRAAAAKTYGTVWFHPQRGGALTIEPVPPGYSRYRGGPGEAWRTIARVEVSTLGGTVRPLPGQKLPKGYLWGSPEQQEFGLGYGHQVYGPLEKRCSDCGAAFVWPARAQQHLYEVIRVHVDVTAKRCRSCARKRKQIEDARTVYAQALAAADGATTPKPYLEVARATLELVELGGRAGIERAIGSCRRARRLGAGAVADQLEARLRAVRAG
jgi:putative zinc ribbon protein